jgi:hypothetical protein
MILDMMQVNSSVIGTEKSSQIENTKNTDLVHIYDSVQRAYASIIENQIKIIELKESFFFRASFSFWTAIVSAAIILGVTVEYNHLSSLIDRGEVLKILHLLSSVIVLCILSAVCIMCEDIDSSFAIFLQFLSGIISSFTVHMIANRVGISTDFINTQWMTEGPCLFKKILLSVNISAHLIFLIHLLIRISSPRIPRKLPFFPDFHTVK